MDSGTNPVVQKRSHRVFGIAAAVVAALLLVGLLSWAGSIDRVRHDPGQDQQETGGQDDTPPGYAAPPASPLPQ